MLAVLLLSSLVVVSAQAAVKRRKHPPPPGAIQLPNTRLKHLRGIVCGNVHGRWIPGTLFSPRYFVADAEQARRYARLARREGGRARTADLRRARFYERRSNRRQPLCAAIRAKAAAAGLGGPLPTPVGASSSRDVYVSPQFFGQHLMFYWGLDPAIPVHAMRLGSSNTAWCQMDNGTASNQYNFGQLDALLGQASRLNADVEFVFAGTPQWAVAGAYPQASVTDQCGSQSTMAPADESYWTNFVTALVTHARGQIHAYELWNEVDYSAFWTGGMDAMVRMSIDAAAIIHRIDPSALVLSPSITATPEGYAFLHHYLTSLPPGTVDAIAVHLYTGGAWPEDAVPAEMNAIRAALPPAYANTPIWSTEGGWGENSWFSSSASDQRAFIARYDLQLLSQGVVRGYWYAYPNTQWGTLWDGSSLTPAGVATATVEGWLTGATLHGCATADGNLWTCGLTTATGVQARIVWVRNTPVPGYSTSGYSTIDRLDGSSSPAGDAPITVSTEPVMLSS